MAAKHFIKADGFRPLRDNVFVTDLESGPSITHGGILIPDDNMTDRGVRPRWGKVWAVGPDVTEVSVGEWVLVKHGRWTQGIEMTLAGEKNLIWRIEFPDAVLIVSDADPRVVVPVSFNTAKRYN